MADRTSAPDLEILGDQVTLHPSGYIEPEEKPQHEAKERNLVEHMARFRSNPLEFLREVSLHVSGVRFQPLATQDDTFLTFHPDRMARLR